MKLKSLLFSLSLLLAAVSMSAQSVTGIWKTVDDDTNEAKSHVEVYMKNGKVHGKVVKLLAAATTDICIDCPGAKKNKSLIGMDIIEGLQKTKYYYSKGTIVDPAKGSEYNCSMWLDEKDSNVLKVRGKHWTGIYRTQTWYRVK